MDQTSTDPGMHRIEDPGNTRIGSKTAEPLLATDSNAKFNLHPIVLVNISDHYARSRIQLDKDFTGISCGILLGMMSGKNLEVFSCFEIPLPDKSEINTEYIQSKCNLSKTMFPSFEPLGWYIARSAPKIQKSDISLHKQFGTVLENPLLLLCSMDPELQYSIYEEDSGSLVRNSDISIATDSAERIALDTMTKSKPESKYAAENYVHHLQSLGEAVYVYSNKLGILLDFLTRYQKGDINPPEHIVRQVLTTISALQGLSSTENPLVDGYMSASILDTVIINSLASASGQREQIEQLAEKVGHLIQSRSLIS